MRACPPPDPACFVTPELTELLRRAGGDVVRAARLCDRADLLLLCLPLATGACVPVLRAASRVALARAEHADLAREHVAGLARAFDAWFEEAAGSEAIHEALRTPILAIPPGARPEAFLNALGDLYYAAYSVEKSDGTMPAFLGSKAMERLGFAESGVRFGRFDDEAYLEAQSALAAEIRAQLGDG